MSLLDFFRRPPSPAIPSSFAEARPHLMPALRGRGMVEYLRLTDTSSGLLFQPFSRDAALMLVHDRDDAMQPFGPEQLAQWGVTINEVQAAAMDNLRDATVDRFTRVAPGVHAGDWGDAYDSARLLLPDLAHRVAGANPAAMIPNRGTLLLASGNDVDAMRAMVALARRIADEDPRPVSALLYRYEDGRPVEYLPQDAALRDALQRLDRQYRHGDYAAQKETLDALHEKNGTDILVASYKVMREEAGGTEYSICIWTKGVDTLLPRTDRIALSIHDDAEERQDLLILPWDPVHAACADMMEPVPGAFPERYRATGFPDLGRLRQD
jgi:hypothetical protein